MPSKAANGFKAVTCAALTNTAACDPVIRSIGTCKHMLTGGLCPPEP